MEQFNKALPVSQEEKQIVTGELFLRREESPVLSKVRQKFGLFGGISLLFGIIFAILFYKTGVGLNICLFTLFMITILIIVMNKLALTIKKGTVVYYAGAALLGLSTMLTASEILKFMNVIGIMLLLDLSLLHQCYEVKEWDFMKHFLKMIGLAFQSIGMVWMPFVDCLNRMKQIKIFRNDKARNIFLGIIISIPFLWVVTALLASADLMFGSLTGDIFDFIFSMDILPIVFMITFGFFACYCILCAAVSKVGKEESRTLKKAEATIAVTLMSILTLLYIFFSGIQIVFLFAKGLFILPEGYTYAEYARRGFFELLAVTIINVVLMLLCRALFTESKLLRLMITGMSICTYIMIASATYRMLLYIGAYHLTFLRVFVLLSLFIIAMVLTGVIISGYQPNFPLFHYCVAVITICYIIFSFSEPDYFIADYLINQKQILDREDVTFLTYELSLDAAPKVLPILSNKSRYTLEESVQNKYDQESYLNNNNNTTYDLVVYYDQRIISAKDRMEFRDFDYSNYLANQTYIREKKR